MKTIRFFKQLFFCTIIFLFSGQLSAQSCQALVESLTSPWGDDVKLNSYKFITSSSPDSVFVSLDINGPYSSDLVLNCGDASNVTGPVTVYVQIFENGIVDSCVSSLSFLDLIPPLLSVKQDVTVFLDQNGNGTLTIEQFDNGSYDNCTPITLSLSQTEFNTSHIGKNKVWLTAIDTFGNYNTSWGEVLVVGVPTLICDFLSRTSPITDCSLGHSNQDDVEWPADISISEDLIEPQDLIDFSNVDPLDARPSFYNSPNAYTASYQDSLVYLDSFTLILDRKWVAHNSVYNLDWDYTQKITVELTNFGDFKDKVRVLNVVNREMPEVAINGTEITNAMGEATIVGDVVSLDYNDESLNGINILDLIEMQHHILGIKEFANYDQIISANVNGDDRLTTIDIVQLFKVIFSEKETAWKFIEKETAGVFGNISKGIYKGYKIGDVNGDATLVGEPEPQYDILIVSIEDKVLNKGERYSIPIYVDQVNQGFGIELRIHLENIIIEDITGGIFNPYYKVDINGDLVIIDYSTSSTILDPNIPVYTLEIYAEENTLVNNALTKSINKSFFVDDSYTLMEIELDMNKAIPTGVDDQSSVSCKVYPNPSSSVLFIETQTEEFDVSLFNSSGVKVKSMHNETKMDVSNLPSGVYTFVISDKENVFNQKVIILD